MPPRILIINADDLGYDPGFDRGILRAARLGIVTSTTLMVDTPFAPLAVAGARDIPALGIGLHLRFLDEPDPSAVARAQLRRFAGLVGRQPTHLDVHKHRHREPAILEAVIELARANHLPMRSIDPEMRERLRASGIATPDAFVGDTGAEPYWTRDRLLAAIDGAAAGTTELMCHPGEGAEAVSSSYGRQREHELAALLMSDVVARARRGDPKLATFAVIT